MTMSLSCHCGASRILATGKPVLHAYCHSQACRELLGGAVVAITLWRAADLMVAPGSRAPGAWVQPALETTRHFCPDCGSALFLVNGLGLRTVPQSLIAASYRGTLPLGFAPTMHLHYAQRELDVADALPKYLERPGGPQYLPPHPTAATAALRGAAPAALRVG